MKKNIFAFSFYLPAKQYGGSLKSIYNLVETTSDNFNYYIITLDHDFKQKEKLNGIKKGEWVKVGKANVRYVNESDFSYENILKWMKEANPDLVYLYSVYYCRFNFPAVKVAKKLGLPVLLAPRSDLLPNCVHHKYYKKLPYLTALKILPFYKGIYYHSTCDEETISILKWMKTDKNHIRQLPNIASFSMDIERKKKEKDKLKLVYIGRVHPRKNLKYAVECLAKMDADVSLDVFGTMEDKEYWDECKKIVNDNRLQYCGVLSPLEIQSKYYEYDCLLFPTLNENYGHVIVESIIAGTPAVISRGTTPWDDYDGQGGYCCDLNDMNSFIVRLKELQQMDEQEYDILVSKNQKYVETHFDNAELCNKYVETFNDLIALYKK